MTAWGAGIRWRTLIPAILIEKTMRHLTALLLVLLSISPCFGQETQSALKADEVPVVGDELEEGFFTLVERMPEYPGGNTALVAKIGRDLQYPAKARKKGIEGTVYVSFIIGTGGSVQSVKVVRGVHPLLDEEAIRVVKNIEGYTPGYQRGKPVRVQFTIPITFRL